MLRAIKTVSQQSLAVIRDQDGRQCTLEQITNIIEAYTQIDEILFVRYDADPENPTWGEFQRWEQFEPYRGERTLVEVRYAEHLSIPWRRFVVCKELSHALDTRRGTHTAGDVEVAELITELALASAANAGNQSVARSAEIIAQAGAIEMLLPMEIRIEMAGGIGNEISTQLIDDIAAKHELPPQYVALAFRPSYMQMMSDIFAQI